MKKLTLVSLLLTTFTLFSFTSDLSGQSLADQVAGNYKGTLRNPTNTQNDYRIKLVKINDTKVRIQPFTGTLSQTIEVDLEEQTMGTITLIKFKMPGDHMANNGMYAAENGRLTYIFHLGGDDDRNIELFSGKRQ